MILTNQTVLRFNIQNRNNRIYSTDGITFHPEGNVMADATMDVQRLVGCYSNMRVEGDNLVCDISISDEQYANITETLGGRCTFVTSGTGDVSSVGSVTNFELASLFPTDKPSFDPDDHEPSENLARLRQGVEEAKVGKGTLIKNGTLAEMRKQLFGR